MGRSFIWLWHDYVHALHMVDVDEAVVTMVVMILIADPNEAVTP